MEIHRQPSFEGRRKLVKVDWREYYRRFEQRHGEPISWKGKLLFRDGWTHSSKDHAGPEWEPPDDPLVLHSMQTVYWQERLKLVTQEKDLLEHNQRGIEALQRGKSLPLVRRVKRWDEESQSMKVDREEVSPDMFKGRLDWLHADIAECIEHLEELKQTTETRSEINAPTY